MTAPSIDIAGRTLGDGTPVMVIAEIGVNHDGSLARALELVRIARDAGADAVKLQVFSADRLLHGCSVLAEYQKQTCDAADPHALLRRYELGRRELGEIDAAIRAQGMLPLATPFSVDDVSVIESLDLPAIKIASPDLVNRVLLERAAETGRPMLVSTGAATMEEVGTCVRWLRGWRASFALLHCVSSYPASDDQAYLGWIGELRREFAAPVGYSDHTNTLLSGALAVAAGACIVERHITYDRSADGPDHAASSDPEQFAEYVRLIRQAERLRGTPGKRVLECEQDVRAVSRQSLVLTRAVAAGEPIARLDLTVQRPGTGIAAAEIDVVVVRLAARALPAGTMLTWDMLRDAA
jgi:sialic acid synthase SpsE